MTLTSAIKTFEHDEDDSTYYGATVGSLVVSAWNSDQQTAEADAALFLDNPSEWLDGMAHLADCVDEAPSLRTAIQDAQQRCRAIAQQLEKQYGVILKTLALVI